MQIAGARAARVLVCTFTMEPQTFDLSVPNRECADYGLDAYAASLRELNRLDKNICRYLRAAAESHGPNWTNA